MKLIISVVLFNFCNYFLQNIAAMKFGIDTERLLRGNVDRPEQVKIIDDPGKLETAVFADSGLGGGSEKRGLVTDDGYNDSELSSDETDGILRLIKTYPLFWLSAVVKNAGDLLSRKNRIPKPLSLNHIEDDGQQMDSIYVPAPPFSPRLGRRSEMTKVRDRREGQVNSAMFKPRLGRGGVIDVTPAENRFV